MLWPLVSSLTESPAALPAYTQWPPQLAFMLLLLLIPSSEPSCWLFLLLEAALSSGTLSNVCAVQRGIPMRLVATVFGEHKCRAVFLWEPCYFPLLVFNVTAPTSSAPPFQHFMPPFLTYVFFLAFITFNSICINYLFSACWPHYQISSTEAGNPFSCFLFWFVFHSLFCSQEPKTVSGTKSIC